MNKKIQYYRIEYFKNGQWYKTIITNNEDEFKSYINFVVPDIKIYKCNSKGNNYTGRRIYPPVY